MTRRPPFVVRSSEIPEHEASYPAPFDMEKLAFGKDLGRAAGSRSLGVWRERLPPGRRTTFTHAHLREEELVYVLSGRPNVRWIEPGCHAEEHTLEPGDLAVFPAGTGVAHTVVNRTGEDAELLVVGERRAGERGTYPEDPIFLAARTELSPHRVWEDCDGPSGDARPPAVRIDTERLSLRVWAPVDTPDLLALTAKNREHLLPWMPWAETLPSLDEMLGRVVEWQGTAWAGGDVVYGIFELDGKPVGACGLHDRVGAAGREIGYWIDRERQGRGYVTEAAAALVRVGFEGLDLDRLEIHCNPANVRSAAVPERLGFVHEATLPRRSRDAEGGLEDAMIWSTYRDTYVGSPSARRLVRAFDAVGRRLV